MNKDKVFCYITLYVENVDKKPASDPIVKRLNSYDMDAIIKDAESDITGGMAALNIYNPSVIDNLQDKTQLFPILAYGVEGSWSIAYSTDRNTVKMKYFDFKNIVREKGRFKFDDDSYEQDKGYVDITNLFTDQNQNEQHFVCRYKRDDGNYVYSIFTIFDREAKNIREKHQECVDLVYDTLQYERI